MHMVRVKELAAHRGAGSWGKTVCEGWCGFKVLGFVSTVRVQYREEQQVLQQGVWTAVRLRVLYCCGV
jgi:hypothetical protein